MNYTGIFTLFVDFIKRVFTLLESVYFSAFGFRVSLAGVIFGFMIISVIITIFYKGGRTS